MNTQYRAFIDMKQIGKNGEIEVEMGFNPPPKDFVPPAYEAASALAAKLFTIVAQLDTEDDPEGETYSARFSLHQEVPGDSIYSSLVLEPKLAAEDDDYPTVYEVASHLMTTWLRTIGILSADNEIINEDELHATVNISARERTGTIH